MKMGFVYDAAYPSTALSSGSTDLQHVSLHYSDNNYPGHSGWKEIVATGFRGLFAPQFGARNRPQRRVEQLSNRPADQPASGS
jgi:hypothetical protein